jgi:PAS domain-containing protein
LRRIIGTVAIPPKFHVSREGKAAEKSNRLQELEKKYRILVENISEGFASCNKNMVVTFVNDKVCQIIGYSKDEILGRKVDSFFEGVGYP